MKEQVKKHLTSRLKIGGFIFALVGWLLLITVPLEFVGFKFSGLENFFETPTFKWGLRIFVIIILIILIKGQKVVDDIIEKHRLLKNIVKVILWGGAIGWAVGLGSLLFK